MARRRKKGIKFREIPSKIKEIMKISRAQALSLDASDSRPSSNIQFDNENQEKNAETASRPSDLALILNPDLPAETSRDLNQPLANLREEEKQPYAVRKYGVSNKKKKEYESLNPQDMKKSSRHERDRLAWEDEVDIGTRPMGNAPHSEEGSMIYDSRSQNLNPERKKRNPFDF